MKYFVFITVSLLFVFNVKAQKGDQFPELEGKVLTEEHISFPNDTKGKVTLIGMAYSKKSDKLLKPWFNPIYTTFMQKSEGVSFLPTTSYDVNIYFVGLLKGLAKAASGKIETAMDKNLDPKLHKHTVLSQVKLKQYKAALHLGKKDVPYFFVLDPNGKIIYNTSGAYSDAKLEEITNAVDGFSD